METLFSILFACLAAWIGVSAAKKRNAQTGRDFSRRTRRRRRSLGRTGAKEANPSLPAEGPPPLPRPDEPAPEDLFDQARQALEELKTGTQAESLANVQEDLPVTQPRPQTGGEMVEFSLPHGIGEGVTHAEILRWLVHPGQRVEANQAIVEIMADRYTLEIHTSVAGRIAQQFELPGALVAVGERLYLLEVEAPGALSMEGGQKPEVEVEPAAPVPGPEKDSSDPVPLEDPSVRALMLFGEGRPGFEVKSIFENEHKGDRIRWRTTVARVEHFRHDQALGEGPGTRLIAEHDIGEVRRLRINVGLPPDAEAGLTQGQTVEFEGELYDCNPYLRAFTVRDARIVSPRGSTV